ncbi:unnamed protein product [Angiostrongylus costaricensis]|uniref:RBR-type E3 ubiquitin transferase n=1 Tax=Angiostrongylus costaricensis TaxID=334426 RepID=A0A158PMA6_ANGCS|nr:unnamed protein product [Angiostrongylus costaricensis]
MSTGTREEQRAELEALRSIYDESHVMFNDGICLNGKVVVEMEPLTKPLTVYVTTEKVELFYHVLSGRESVVLTNLPPVLLMFHLPPDYPLVRPELELECEWMNEELISTIKVKLEEVCNENLGMGVLFFCYEAIADVVKSSFSELTELCIDDTPYGVRNNMERIELLRRVDDSGSRSADCHFKSVCHDCEVCFQCKPGTQCLLFRPCQHVFCKECVTTFFFEILNNQEIRPLGCLALECSSLASEQAIQSIIGEKEFERYERILLEQALAVMDDVVPCPRKICQNPVFKVIDTILSEGWINGNSKPCPRCRIRIEKAGGCNKMQCSKCDAMFCWLCYRVLDKDDPYLHYRMEDSDCANRLFEGMTTSEDEDDENFAVDRENAIEDGNESDDNVEIPLIRSGSEASN